MNGREDIISTQTVGALCVFIKNHPDIGRVRDIVDEAVHDWMVRRISQSAAESGAGYRWKTIFLPAGTDVRLDYANQTFHARVVGEKLIFRNRAASPRQMLMEVTGLSGNTWDWLYVRRPGDRHFVQARVLRSRVRREGPVV